MTIIINVSSGVVSLSDSTPAVTGTGASGSSVQASRADHVHGLQAYGHIVLLKEGYGTHNGAVSDDSTYTFGAGDLDANDQIIFLVYSACFGNANTGSLRFVSAGATVDHTLWTNETNKTISYITAIQELMHSTDTTTWACNTLKNNQGTLTGVYSQLSMVTANAITTAWSVSFRITSNDTIFWRWAILKVRVS
jgi:hypothetical protein